jgi:hypothetical protein
VRVCSLVFDRLFRSIASAGGLGKSASAVPCQVYLCVSNYTTQVFRCQAIGNGESVLQAYPGVVCGTAYHQALQTVGSIGFIVYMIGYPLGCFAALLYIYKNDLRTDPEMLRMFGWVIPTIQPSPCNVQCATDILSVQPTMSRTTSNLQRIYNVQSHGKGTHTDVESHDARLTAHVCVARSMLHMV